MSSVTWLAPDLVFDGEVLRPGLVLGVQGGHVAHLLAREAVPEGAHVRPLNGIVSPGFIDLQVNGGGDVLVNDAPTPERLARIIAAHHRLGTVGLLPTVITDAPGAIDRAARAVRAGWGMPGLLGLHIEGPHIAPARRGTHASGYVRPLEESTIALVEDLRAAGIPVMITLAPEAATGQGIGRLAATGAIVSIGHSDATAEEVRASLAAGARCFTHLFNAMSPMLNRAPGVVGAAINSTAYAGIICDGHHVADEMVGLAIRARPEPDRMFLVSDAMPTVGGGDRFSLYGAEIRMENGRLVNAEGSLAGAHVTMAEGVARLIGTVGVAPEVALRMAVTVPARLIGRPDLATLEGREVADLVLLDDGFAYRGSLAQGLPAVTPAPR
ncbi:MAG: amidohydrolase family protein [Limimaricola sp.]|uniref:N-acetylglucosamine-6-phosphate deacetylase n=1 Tax=Limimaricola sp. TaxID=2211665 RepID=UPI001D8E9BE9|nr:N-acetylglucosamine-6-phosphate deacetylase [Limimaricola sp.]MBI1416584.1 amidohydrolase family protein [Limimaricola sp.]